MCIFTMCTPTYILLGYMLFKAFYNPITSVLYLDYNNLLSSYKSFNLQLDTTPSTVLKAKCSDTTSHNDQQLPQSIKGKK